MVYSRDTTSAIAERCLPELTLDISAVCQTVFRLNRWERLTVGVGDCGRIGSMKKITNVTEFVARG